MPVLVGAAVLIIIAVAVFLFALGVLRRQVGQQRAVTGESVGELVVVPVQEFSANYPGTAFPLISGDVRSDNGRDLGDLKRESHQFVPQHSDFMSQDPLVFATEPVPTEHISELSTPDATRLPSTPVPQQQEIPSTPATPTDLWEVPMGEIVTDPVLEAMMHEAQMGLYVIPEREDKPEA